MSYHQNYHDTVFLYYHYMFYKKGMTREVFNGQYIKENSGLLYRDLGKSSKATFSFLQEY